MSMTYRDALAYLYSLTNYEIKSTFAYAPQFFDLRRVERLLEAVDNPQQKFRSIHIAGTKGKGSTSCMLASILQAAGYRVGLYTSPHLHSFRERIQVNGTLIAEDELAAIAERLRPIAIEDPELTTFEVATALAFAHFAASGVEIAVVEVGLGGRLDATNVIQPLVSVITTIGHDHMHILGHTLAEIAGEKAGIIKEGVPVVTAPQQPDALRVIRQAAKSRKSILHETSQEWSWRGVSTTLDHQEFTASRRHGRIVTAPDTVLRRLAIPLLGKHQQRNAAVVLTTVDALRSAGLHVDNDAVRAGLAQVSWPARFEVMSTAPAFVIDGAHNVDSARSLDDTLRLCFPNIKPWYVLAILQDKDIPAILHELLPRAAGAYFARSNHPRAAEPESLQAQARRYGMPTRVIPSVEQATAQALLKADPADLVVAAGSFSTAAEAREYWLRTNGRPLPPTDPL